MMPREVIGAVYTLLDNEERHLQGYTCRQRDIEPWTQKFRRAGGQGKGRFERRVVYTLSDRQYVSSFDTYSVCRFGVWSSIYENWSNAEKREREQLSKKNRPCIDLHIAQF